MIIKRPYSDIALRNLQEMLRFVKERFCNCVHHDHDVITLLYISSLMISPDITIDGQRSLLDEIRDLVNVSPPNFICLVRTTEPTYFRNRGSMQKRQRRSIDYLRDKCYVAVYSPQGEFLNHAKFVIHYHVCFTERIVYHSKYYGSTNLTSAGLAHPRGRTGNYEEFNMTRPRAKFRLSRGDVFYLDEALSLLMYKVDLYTDSAFLRRYLTGHLMHMERVLGYGHRVVRGTTLGELYDAYLGMLMVYNQTYAFLGELPGKLLTEKLKNELMRLKPPVDLFELEMIMHTDVRHAEAIAKDLGYDHNVLRIMIKELIDVLEQAIVILKDGYLTKINEVTQYFDEKEQTFFKLVTEYGKKHVEALKKAKSSFV